MKKIKICLLVLSILALSMVSCSDQLEETVYSELITTTAYETEEDAQALILSVYAALRGSDWGHYYAYYYMEVSESGTDTYGLDDWDPGTQRFEVGTFDNNEPHIVSLWEGCYKVIGSANFALDILEGMDIDESVKASLIGEAKFLRALAYYDLTFNFGDVILNTAAGNTEDLPLSSQADVVAQIISDFTDAANVLGETTSPGRASRGAALGLRAKTYLQTKNWTEAATDAKAVIDLGEYSLFPNVTELYHAANNAASEWIFAVMSTQDGTGPSSQIAWHANSKSYMQGGWGRLTLAPDFYNSFDMTDDRRNLIANGYQHGNKREDDGIPRYYALPGTPEYDALANDPNIGLRDLNSLTTNKYMAGFDRFDHPAPGYFGANYPILRFADILLMRAEALNELGETVNAIPLVNEVRSRSNAAPLAGLDQAALRNAILEERAKEFFMEGKRRLDLIRSGRYIELWKANLERKYPDSNFDYLNQDRVYFPIPQSEIDANEEID